MRTLSNALDKSFQLLSSEWLKTKRTPIRLLAVSLPVLLAGLMTGYFFLKPLTPETQIALFEAFFETWGALVVPFGSGLITGLMIHHEELAGGFNNILSGRLPRQWLYLGKLTMLVFLTALSTVLGVGTLLLGMKFVLNIPVSWPIFITAAIMAILGSLPLLAFHLWLSLAKGMGASVGIGGVGILIAALMATNLGNKIWFFIPWAWPVRFSYFAGVNLIAPEGLVAGLVFQQAIKAFIPGTLFLATVLAGGLLWFSRWEGRKGLE